LIYISLKQVVFTPVYIGAKGPFIFRWGVGKSLLRIQGFIGNKKFRPEKVSINWYLQIYTLPPTQKLEFILFELTCLRPKKQKWFNWKMQKLRFPISKMKRLVKKLYSFEFFVEFSTDSESPAIKFFRTDFK
jgi:hypothetical protein